VFSNFWSVYGSTKVLLGKEVLILSGKNLTILMYKNYLFTIENMLFFFSWCRDTTVVLEEQAMASLMKTAVSLPLRFPSSLFLPPLLLLFLFSVSFFSFPLLFCCFFLFSLFDSISPLSVSVLLLSSSSSLLLFFCFCFSV
jgi:hypothetical protein